MLNPKNEQFVVDAVTNGEIEMDHQGCFWRVAKRTADRWRGGTKLNPCERVRAEMKNEAGYLQVRVMVNRVRKCAAAHRLVWLLTYGPIPDGMTINHINGIKSDNRPQNLELATMSEQRIHAVYVLKVNRNRPKGSLHPKTKLDESDVLTIRSRRQSGEMVKTIAADYGMNPKAVSAIVNRRTWKHL